jgi:hypothetical protein
LATPAGRRTLNDAAWVVKSACPVPVSVTDDAGPLIDALNVKLVVVTAVVTSRCADLADRDEAPALPVSPKVAPMPITPAAVATVSHFLLVRAISHPLQL